MMRKSFLPFFHLILSLAQIIFPSSLHAQDTPQDYVDAHNAARSALNLEPMTWNDTLANYAKQKISDCKFQHSSPLVYGENLAARSFDMSAADVVKIWVDEKEFYDYDTNSCQPYQLCGHYTQVVWRKSVRLGCAKIKCPLIYGTPIRDGIFIGCNYDPPGNIAGEKPYEHLLAMAQSA